MRRRKASVELFEEIRREYEFGVGTVQGVARRFGVHRRLVREALGAAVPIQRPSAPRARPRVGPVTGFVDAGLEADRRAPRKQRHTAHRIYERLRAERPDCPAAESTVRRLGRERKAALGLLARETFVPQSHAWGGEAQVDWYEAVAELDGVATTLQVFALRSMAGGAAFHRAYHRATQQAFLEAHELAFAYAGGVFRRLRYDNLGAAVQRVLRGARREETARFVAFRSHWRFAAAFCTPAAAQEKGGVENEVGRFRRALGAGAARVRPGGADSAPAGRLPRGRGAHRRRPGADHRRRHDGRAGAPAAAGRRAVRPGRGQLPDREPAGLRARGHQRLLGVAAG
jgi:transposase